MSKWEITYTTHIKIMVNNILHEWVEHGKLDIEGLAIAIYNKLGTTKNFEVIEVKYVQSDLLEN